MRYREMTLDSILFFYLCSFYLFLFFILFFLLFLFSFVLFVVGAILKSLIVGHFQARDLVAYPDERSLSIDIDMDYIPIIYRYRSIHGVYAMMYDVCVLWETTRQKRKRKRKKRMKENKEKRRENYK